jgi:hypothetical protein
MREVSIFVQSLPNVSRITDDEAEESYNLFENQTDEEALIKENLVRCGGLPSCGDSPHHFRTGHIGW